MLVQTLWKISPVNLATDLSICPSNVGGVSIWLAVHTFQLLIGGAEHNGDRARGGGESGDPDCRRAWNHWRVNTDARAIESVILQLHVRFQQLPFGGINRGFSAGHRVQCFRCSSALDEITTWDSHLSHFAGFHEARSQYLLR